MLKKEIKQVHIELFKMDLEMTRTFRVKSKNHENLE